MVESYWFYFVIVAGLCIAILVTLYAYNVRRTSNVYEVNQSIVNYKVTRQSNDRYSWFLMVEIIYRNIPYLLKFYNSMYDDKEDIECYVSLPSHGQDVDDFLIEILTKENDSWVYVKNSYERRQVANWAFQVYFVIVKQRRVLYDQYINNLETKREEKKDKLRYEYEEKVKNNGGTL